MTAKEYLGTLKELKDYLDQEKRDLAKLKREAESLGGTDCREERVQTTKSGTPRYAVIMDQVVDLERQILMDTVDYFVKKEEITDQIQRIRDADCMSLLYKRYIQGLSLRDIAREMDFSYSYIRQLHGKALQEFEAVYTDPEA